jgi:hypothetical protein
MKINSKLKKKREMQKKIKIIVYINSKGHELTIQFCYKLLFTYDKILL